MRFNIPEEHRSCHPLMLGETVFGWLSQSRADVSVREDRRHGCLRLDGTVNGGDAEGSDHELCPPCRLFKAAALGFVTNATFRGRCAGGLNIWWFQLFVH